LASSTLAKTLPVGLARIFQKSKNPNFDSRANPKVRQKPMNPTQLTDEQCLTIWNCCFDPDLRKAVPLEYVPDCIRTCLGPGAAGNIDGLERFALKLWEQNEHALASQLETWAREQREAGKVSPNAAITKALQRAEAEVLRYDWRPAPLLSREKPPPIGSSERGLGVTPASGDERPPPIPCAGTSAN
jgi:hypothetical protein